MLLVVELVLTSWTVDERRFKHRPHEREVLVVVGGLFSLSMDGVSSEVSVSELVASSSMMLSANESELITGELMKRENGTTLVIGSDSESSSSLVVASSVSHCSSTTED